LFLKSDKPADSLSQITFLFCFVFFTLLLIIIHSSKKEKRRKVYLVNFEDIAVLERLYM